MSDIAIGASLFYRSYRYRYCDDFSIYMCKSKIINIDMFVY